MKTWHISLGFLLLFLCSLNLSGKFRSLIYLDNSYHVSITDETPVLLNVTHIMGHHDNPIFYNFTITEENNTLTVVTEIFYENTKGKLFAVYFEEKSVFESSNSVQDLTIIMNQVSNYTVVHVIVVPGKYLLIISDFHFNEEPETQFNLLLLQGKVGTATSITRDSTIKESTEQSTETMSLPTALFFGSLVIIVMRVVIKRRIFQ